MSIILINARFNMLLIAVILGGQTMVGPLHILYAQVQLFIHLETRIIDLTQGICMLLQVLEVGRDKDSGNDRSI